MPRGSVIIRFALLQRNPRGAPELLVALHLRLHELARGVGSAHVRHAAQPAGAVVPAAVRRYTAQHLEAGDLAGVLRSEEHTSELQSLMRLSYAVFCSKKKKKNTNVATTNKISNI